MGLVRLVFRRNRFLGHWEEEELRKVIAAHVPDWLAGKCHCGEDVNPGNWEEFLTHVHSAMLLAGRRMGPRFWE